MAKAIAGVVGGLVAWMLIATIGNLATRMAWASYSAVEASMGFTPAMMTARLFLGALSSLGAGWVVAWITNRNGRAISAFVGILIVVFIPVHYALWQKFPLWYHVVFFVSLAVMTLLGAIFNRHKVNRGR
jgi:hypothetical protein